MTDTTELQQFLDRVAADFVRRLKLQVTSVAPGEVAMLMFPLGGLARSA